MLFTRITVYEPTYIYINRKKIMRERLVWGSLRLAPIIVDAAVTIVDAAVKRTILIRLVDAAITRSILQY